DGSALSQFRPFHPIIVDRVLSLWARSARSPTAKWRPRLLWAKRPGLDAGRRVVYLSTDWTCDVARRERAHVPEAVRFQEKWRLVFKLLAARTRRRADRRSRACSPRPPMRCRYVLSHPPRLTRHLEDLR